MLSTCDSLQASLNDLNQRLDAPILMNRFRPNIVLHGEQAPWAEDEWGKRNIRVQLKQGSAVDLELCKPCSRCTVSSPFTWQLCIHAFSNFHMAAVHTCLLKSSSIHLDLHTYVHTDYEPDSMPCTVALCFTSFGQTAMSHSSTVANGAVDVCVSFYLLFTVVLIWKPGFENGRMGCMTVVKSISLP